ncbi:MAG: hypothetical protein AVDCRST_MAG30-4493 [uncultured Solirubrobacteraceae bacterium]|uniref:Uncharacterized protein n=1 Tax=uncultured Solirubrobacteraceae bacterium TaxID=1162706 RepID=A0A6J4U1W1_9ACTN|nr:MAG: hypothetical protein AVDCRST_MAG30-4493 [uncultured Solirubrobacteraceae bacterium]
MLPEAGELALEPRLLGLRGLHRRLHGGELCLQALLARDQPALRAGHRVAEALLLLGGVLQAAVDLSGRADLGLDERLDALREAVHAGLAAEEAAHGAGVRVERFGELGVVDDERAGDGPRARADGARGDAEVGERVELERVADHDVRDPPAHRVEHAVERRVGEERALEGVAGRRGVGDLLLADLAARGDHDRVVGLDERLDLGLDGFLVGGGHADVDRHVRGRDALEGQLDAGDRVLDDVRRRLHRRHAAVDAVARVGALPVAGEILVERRPGDREVARGRVAGDPRGQHEGLDGRLRRVERDDGSVDGQVGAAVDHRGDAVDRRAGRDGEVDRRRGARRREAQGLGGTRRRVAVGPLRRARQAVDPEGRGPDAGAAAHLGGDPRRVGGLRGLLLAPQPGRAKGLGGRAQRGELRLDVLQTRVAGGEAGLLELDARQALALERHEALDDAAGVDA